MSKHRASKKDQLSDFGCTATAAHESAANGIVNRGSTIMLFRKDLE